MPHAHESQAEAAITSRAPNNGSAGIYLRTDIGRALGLNAVATAALSQLLYWHTVMRRSKGAGWNGWLWKTDADIGAEILAGARSMLIVRRALIECGAVEYRRQGVPARSFYRIVFVRLQGALDAWRLSHAGEDEADAPADEQAYDAPAAAPVGNIFTTSWQENANLSATSSEQVGENLPTNHNTTQDSTQDTTHDSCSAPAGAERGAPAEPVSGAVLTPVQAMVEAYYAMKGFECTDWGKEARAASWLIGRGYSFEHVKACYDWLKTDKWWATKDVSLMSIRSKIGHWATSAAPTVDIGWAEDLLNGGARGNA